MNAGGVVAARAEVGGELAPTGGGLEILQVNTGRVLVHGYARRRAVLDVDAELDVFPDGPHAYIALVVSGDATHRETTTMDVEEAARLATALASAVAWHRAGCPTDGPIGGGR